MLCLSLSGVRCKAERRNFDSPIMCSLVHSIWFWSGEFRRVILGFRFWDEIKRCSARTKCVYRVMHGQAGEASLQIWTASLGSTQTWSITQGASWIRMDEGKALAIRRVPIMWWVGMLIGQDPTYGPPNPALKEYGLGFALWPQTWVILESSKGTIQISKHTSL